MATTIGAAVVGARRAPEAASALEHQRANDSDDGGDSVTEPARTADQNLYKAIYAGDTYQLTKKITLNLGLRVDLQGDWTERFNRIVVFNPTETSPIATQVGMPNLKGAYDLVSSSQHSSRTAFDAWNNVSPRLGVSYQFDKSTVIRTGYGIFYLPVDGRWDDAPHNLFINSFNTNLLAVQADGVTPKFALSNPFPNGITPPFGRNQASGQPRLAIKRLMYSSGTSTYNASSLATCYLT